MKHRSGVMAATIAITACAGAGARHVSSPEFQSPDGRPVTLSHLPANRIASIMQSATEWIVALHQEQRLVARTDYDREPSLAQLPSLGGGLDASPEAVAALHPDVVIGWRNRASVDLAHALEPFHIPVISLETTDTADAFGNLARMGRLVGREALADSLAGALRADLAAARAAACPRGIDSSDTVLIELWTDPPITSGRGTWLSTLAETACLVNVFGDLRAPWPTVSLEAVVSRNPKWILTTTGKPGERLADLRSRNGWRDLDAVRAGRVLQIPADLFARPGPSMAQAARAIVAARQNFAR